MKHVCYFRHALALDERRVKFLPEYAYGGASKDPPELDKKISSPASLRSSESEFQKASGNTPPTSNENEVDRFQTSKESRGDRPQTLEVWFVGTHSDM